MHPMFDKTREILKEWYKDSDKFNDGVVAVREAIAGEHLLSMEADHRDLICPTVDNPNIVIYRLISDNVKQLG